MKTKLLSFVLCIAVLGCVWLLLKHTSKKTEITAETIRADQEEPALPATGVPTETEVSDAFVVQTARDVESLMTNLAYSSVSDTDGVMRDLAERLDRSRQYLKDVKADYHGAGYFLTVANFLEDIA
ncbi:MAG: hypothetical protein J6Z79_05520, partial [Clostridia bacterium]|nr:hypothetical protein [Clostridia bacterium]